MRAMTQLSSSLTLVNRKTLVVGTNSVAVGIANELCAQNAQVTLVGEQPPETLPENITYVSRGFETKDIDDCWLAVAASDSATENELVERQCESHRVFCYLPESLQRSTWQPVNTSLTPVPLTGAQETGLVSLVGAGPGDPDLLTLRALKLIQNADAIVYDRLVSKQIMDLCNSRAKFVYAGKEKSNHALPQQSINELLMELATQYNNVVRLKGGDPFIFGRGGEEIETLAESNIAFQVVPGITAASGCAAFSGIPLTHRDHAQSCIFVTGHLRDGQINLNWQELTDPQRTIVVYMGLTGLETICRSLIEHGRSNNTPAALIERGTSPTQRVLSATLKDLPTMVANSNVSAPTLLIIGGVVSLRDKLKWFDVL